MSSMFDNEPHLRSEQFRYGVAADLEVRPCSYCEGQTEVKYRCGAPLIQPFFALLALFPTPPTLFDTESRLKLTAGKYLTSSLF
jgi:hypothetical protein